MADLARLILRLEADNARLQKDLDKAQTQVNKFKSDVAARVSGIGATIGKGIGIGVAAAATGFGVLLKKAIDTADEMSLLAQKTGISTEALSQLNYAAKLSGVDELGDALIKFNKTIAEAGTGGKEQAQAFRDLGINIKGANGELRPTEDLLTAVAEQFSKYQDSAEKTAVAQKLFGKSGADLIPFLNQGKDGIQALREEADKLGLTIGTDTATAANDFNDALDKIKSAAFGGANLIAKDLTPAMRDFADLVSSPEFINGLSSVAQGIAKIAKAAATGISYVGEFGKALGFIAAKAAGAEELPFENKIEELQAAIKNTKSQISAGELFHLDTTKNQQELVALQTELHKTIRLQERFQKDYGTSGEPPANPAAPAAPTVEPPKPHLVNHDPSAIQAAANEARALVKAQSDAIRTVSDAAAEAQKQQLENDLADNLKSYSDYYAERLSIEQKAIDQEIAARQSELTGATAAEQEKIGAEIAALTTKRDQIAKQSAHDRAQSEKDLADQISGIQQRLLEETGQSAAARAIAIEKEYKDLIARLTIEGRTADAAIVVKLQGVEQAKSQFDDLMQQIADVQDAYQRRQQEIDLAVQTGLKTRAQGQREAAEAAKDTAAQEAILADKAEVFAKEIGDPELTRTIAGVRNEIAQTGLVGRRAFLQITGAVEDNLTTAFEEILDGTKSVGDAFKDLLAGIVRDVNRLIAQHLSQQLVDSIFGGFKQQQGMGTSSGGFDLGSIFSGIAGIFGSSSGPQSSGPAGVIWAPDGAPTPLAKGGPMASGGLFLVGEEGPELIRPNFSGTVIPAARTAEILSSLPHRGVGGFVAANQPFVGGEFGPELVMRNPSVSASRAESARQPDSIHITLPIEAPKGTVSKSTQQQVAAAAARGIRIAGGRDN